MSFKKSLLAGAAVALLAGAFTSPAFAVTQTVGGSSLLAPYLSEIFLYFTNSTSTPSTSDQVQLWTAGATSGTAIATPPYKATNPNQLLHIGTASTDDWNYLSSNSTGGIAGFYTQTALWLGNNVATANFTHLNAPIFGVSDLALTKGTTTSDIDVYNNGGTDAGFTGISFVAPGVSTGINNTTVFKNPNDVWQALIQVPLTIDPVALAYNPTNLNIATTDGLLHLDKAAYCGILNGQITNWNDSHLKALNNNTTLNSNLAITLVGRTNGSGSTSILVHHLASVCANSSYYTGTNYYVQGGTNGFDVAQDLPAALVGSGVAPNHFNQQSGSGGVASTITSTTGAIGYIGADWVTGSVTGSLPAAALQVGTGSSFDLPSTSNVVTAFGTVSPPSTTSDRADQTKWVPIIPDPSVGYPIVGTTNALIGTKVPSSRLASLTGAGSTGVAPGFLRWYYQDASANPAVGTILGSEQLGQLPEQMDTSLDEEKEEFFSFGE